MFIRQLQVTVYPPDGSRWSVETTKHPSWKAVEAAIRQLDRDQFPFIWLFRNADAAGTDIPDYTVIGGQGSYTFGPEGTLFYNETGSDEQVDIWLSDQGASVPQWQVCHDLDLVIGATRLFAETGQLDPALTWKTV